MTPSVVIVGFEKDYSNQIRQLLEYTDAVASVRICHEEKQSSRESCWHDNDIALINGYNHRNRTWIRDCLTMTGKQPPPSLIIGDSCQLPEWHGKERRAAPRLHLSDNQLSGDKLVDAIQRLSSARYLPPINRKEHTQRPAEYHQDDSNKYQAIPDAVLPPAPFSDRELLQKNIYVGQYQLKQLLGVGGMASVYQAVDSEQKPVAIKLFNPKVLGDERLLDRFIEEYELLSTVDHSNVITVYEQGFTDSHVYIAMQLLENDCLKSRIRNGLSVENALQHAIDITHALSTIHELGILHRDLKPNNILFNQNDRAVITDFGIAKGIGLSKSPDLTMQGEAVGTPAYMSPEQVLGQQLTASSDLYAFGVILYRMLTGKLLFRAKTPIAMMQHHLESSPPHLPPELIDLDHIVQRLLSKQPKRRYESARKVHDELKQFAN